MSSELRVPITTYNEENSESIDELTEAQTTTVNTTEMTTETGQDDLDDETEIDEDDDETESESEEEITEDDISESKDDNIKLPKEYKLGDFELLKTIGELSQSCHK